VLSEAFTRQYQVVLSESAAGIHDVEAVAVMLCLFGLEGIYGVSSNV
jgi:hypothetical protein